MSKHTLHNHLSTPRQKSTTTVVLNMNNKILIVEFSHPIVQKVSFTYVQIKLCSLRTKNKVLSPLLTNVANDT